MKVAGFGESYLAVEFHPSKKPDGVDKFDGWVSMSQPGVTFAITLGTSFESKMRQWFPNGAIKVVEAPARGFNDGVADRPDVFVISDIQNATLVRTIETARSQTRMFAVLWPLPCWCRRWVRSDHFCEGQENVRHIG